MTIVDLNELFNPDAPSDLRNDLARQQLSRLQLGAGRGVEIQEHPA